MAPPRPIGYWLREALAAEMPESRYPAPLIGTVECDVAIVGGGYTGLWTAWHLTERAPGARIVILEQETCGSGPSGRNGGFVHGWWDQLPYLVERFGDDRALELARASDESVGAIGAFCEENRVDAWYRRGGYLRTSASPAQDGDWDAAVAACRRLGVADQLVELTGEEVRARCASPVMRGGALMPSGATVQPARLARGLRRAVLGRGVTIHELTRVNRIRERNGSLWLEGDHGCVRTPQAVVAVNAWAADWPRFRSSVLAWGSHIVLTEPVPELLADLGWTGGEAITDSRFTVSYFRTTPDGRVAFGAGVGAVGYGGRNNQRFDGDPGAEQRARASLARLLPTLAEARIDDAWGGPIDVSPDRLPMIGSLAGGRLHFAHGYSGNGVAPAHLAGRILAALTDGGTDPVAQLPIVGRRVRRYPPEPFRYLGARVIREALIRADEAGDAGRHPNLLVRLLAGLPRLLGYRLGHAAPH